MAKGPLLLYFKMLRLLIILIVLFLFPFSGLTETREFYLDNGLKVIIIEDHKVPITTFQIWYRVGSRNEVSGKTGLSHLLEHMMFKGTPKYPKTFSKIIQRNGGVDNAMTTKDYTMYFETLSSDRINLAIDLESDRMRNLILDPKETLSERNVVMEERRLRYEDDPQNSLFELVTATAIMNHPYRNPVIGWMSDLSNIKVDDLRGFYEAHYRPDNAFIVVAGDIKADDILEKIKSAFGKEARSVSRPQTKDVTVEPQQKGEKRLILKKEAELPYILIAYHTPSIPHEDSYALDVLSTILSGGKSSRIHRSLIYDKKIALDAGSDYSGMYRDPFLFFFWATASPGKEISEIEKALYDEIDRIKNEPPSERELQKAKNQIESFFIFSQDSLYMQAMIIGRFEVLGDWKLKDKYLEEIRKVRPEDVQRVAKKYLIEDNRTVGILIPTKDLK